ncbi:MAG: glycosyltransferase family A protein [Patescibacteria group bacterium]|jgi:glycosyltransferase involved in cell wall biosynthesis|nr:glycosyltransferase family A protein [Patescibacteria group bacterium]MDD3777959.1 glycosyltransferase family A protein [Patescibacteria group bacterium]MDD3939112.1 glycosyltransferase family A protein [Patescibacteria group bacterium]MDD4443585.1 glycosyltransferase family A protein [Patescibacteria group bacterium]NCU39346.1 glycosyltransferase family 2 protein [Candidatus Falkowbacteria bacterium]
MISVIIPLYNGEKTVIDTLQSLENQSFQDFEVIIINDGSTDDSEKVVADYLKKINSTRSYYFYNQANRGAPAARNHGFKKSQGEYVLFCDADAVLSPSALATMRQALEDNPEASYAYSSFNWGKKLFKLDEFNPERLKKMPYIHSLSLIRRQHFPASGWDESLKKFQDWDLWLAMLQDGHIGIWIPQVLFKIKTGGSMSSWLPAFAYRFFPFLKTVKKYKAAMKIIKQKYGLEN